MVSLAGYSSSIALAQIDENVFSYAVPLLHVLGVHYRILSADISPKIWERILGIRFKNDVSMMKPERDVPMLLRDPLSLLLHLLMQIPINVDLGKESIRSPNKYVLSTKAGNMALKEFSCSLLHLSCTRHLQSRVYSSSLRSELSLERTGTRILEN